MNQHHGRTLRADLKPCARAVRHALFTLIGIACISVFPLSDTYAQQNPVAISKANYSIPAGPLGPALSQFAASADISIATETSMVSGKFTQGIQGTYTRYEGISRLLEGSGLEAIEQEKNSYTLRVITQKDSATTLPTIQVAGNMLISSENTGSYASRGTALFKTSESLKDIPQSISVITSQRMEDQNLTDIRQVLDEVPGIYTNSFGSDYGGRDSVANFFSRGYKINSYMVDGVVANATSNFSNGYSPNESLSGSTAIYDRIEVLRGAAGLLVGPGAPGGTVNLARKLPTADFQQRYSFSAGSWNNYRTEADISGSLNLEQSVRGRIVAAYEDRDRFWAHTNSKSPLLYAIVEADLSNSTTANIGFRYEKAETTAPRGGWFWLMNYAPPRNALPNPAWGFSNVEDKEIFANVKHALNEDWKLNVSAKFVDHDVDALAPKTFANPPTGSTYRLYAWQYKNESTALDANLTGTFNMLGREHKLLIGANAEKENYNARGLWIANYSSRASNPYDYLNFDPINSWTRDAITEGFLNTLYSSPYNKIERKNIGAYAKLNLSMTDNLTAILGSRVSRSEYDNRDSPLSNGKVSAEITPYAGLVYALSPEWSTYASYTDIFQPQWGNYQRDGSLVNHLTGSNYELGIKGELYDGRLNLAAAIYQVDLKNVITSEDPPYDESCAGNPQGGGCVRTLGKQRTRGIDLEASGSVTKNIQASVGYTYLYTEVLKGNSGEGSEFAVFQGYRMPNHMLKLYGSYQFQDKLSGLTIGGGGNIQSKEHRNTDVIQGGLSIWNAFARYQINKNWTASLNINNLFNKNYWPSGVAHTKSVYGTPRNYMLTLQAKF